MIRIVLGVILCLVALPMFIEASVHGESIDLGRAVLLGGFGFALILWGASSRSRSGRK
jgi:hypothetical protein